MLKCNGEMDEDDKANFTDLKRKDENEKSEFRYK